MALRIRCTGCGKKISVDDAFAGGTCRCPYCKEIVLVGGQPKESEDARPYAPVDRPESPDEVQAPSEEAAPVEAVEVPMARPVHIQGVLTIVLMGLVIAMAAAAVWLAVTLSHETSDANEVLKGTPSPTGGVASPTASAGPSGTGVVRTPSPSGSAAVSPTPSASGSLRPAPVGQNPFLAPSEGANAAGIRLEAPVVYVIDAGGSMKNVYDYGRLLVKYSITSLGMGMKFNLVRSAETGVEKLGPSLRNGASAGAESALEFLMPQPRGAVDVEKGVEAAIAMAPKTIVLLVRNEIKGPKELAAKAKTAGVVIHVIGLGSDSASAGSFEALAGATGGQVRTYATAALDTWLEKAPPLE